MARDILYTEADSWARQKRAKAYADSKQYHYHQQLWEIISKVIMAYQRKLKNRYAELLASDFDGILCDVNALLKHAEKMGYPRLNSSLDRIKKILAISCSNKARKRVLKIVRTLVKQTQKVADQYKKQRELSLRILDQIHCI